MWRNKLQILKTQTEDLPSKKNVANLPHFSSKEKFKYNLSRLIIVVVDITTMSYFTFETYLASVGIKRKTWIFR